MARDPAAGDATASFVGFVVEQAVTRVGAEAPRDEGATAELVRRMLADIGTRYEASNDAEGVVREHAAQLLAAEPPLLAAFFQNIDVLFVDGATCADAVSAVTLRAMEISRGGGAG